MRMNRFWAEDVLKIPTVTYRVYACGTVVHQDDFDEYDAADSWHGDDFAEYVIPEAIIDHITEDMV
jgi:hypothetical protein